MQLCLQKDRQKGSLLPGILVRIQDTLQQTTFSKYIQTDYLWDFLMKREAFPNVSNKFYEQSVFKTSRQRRHYVVYS